MIGPSGDADQDVDSWYRIDRVCLDFEDKLRSGERLEPGKYLAGFEGANRGRLIRELIWIAWDYAQERGRALELSEVLGWWPAEEQTIREAFEERQRRAGLEDSNRISPYGERFRPLRRHAEGGLGRVVAAHDVHVDRTVAIKEIRPDCVELPSLHERFLREARIAGRLEHPGIAPIYDVGQRHDGTPFIAMRLIEGQTLKESVDRFHAERHGNSANTQHRRLKSRDMNSLEFRQLLNQFAYVCRVIEFVHERGVVHRDLKPSNIVLGRHGATTVVDWGLAKLVSELDDEPSHETRTLRSPDETMTGEVLGTPAFMSPEQEKGDHGSVGPRSDVYGLGATLYYILTGASPARRKDRETRDRSRYASRRARALLAICETAMEAVPASRYSSAAALADDVERWLADQPIMARKESMLARVQRFMTRHRGLVTAIFLASLVTTLTSTVAALWIAEQKEVLRDTNRVLEQRNQELLAANLERESANRELRFTQQELDEQVKKAQEYFALSQQAEQAALSLMVTRNPYFVTPVSDTVFSEQVEKYTDEQLIEVGMSMAKSVDRQFSKKMFVALADTLNGRGLYEELRQILKIGIDVGKSSGQDVMALELIWAREAIGTSETEKAAEIFRLYLARDRAQTDPEERAVAAMELVRHYLLRGEVENAVEIRDLEFTEARQHCREDREFLFLAKSMEANIQLKQGQLSQVREQLIELESLLSDMPQDGRYVECQLEIARLWHGVFEPEKALDAIGAAEAVSKIFFGPNHPTYLRLMMDRGRVFRSGRRWAEMRDQFKLAESLAASNPALADYLPTIHFFLADSMMGLGEYAAASALLAPAIVELSSRLDETHPLMLEARYLDAALRYHLNDAEEAERLIRVCIDNRLKVWGERHPNTAAAESLLAQLLMSRGEFGECAALTQKAYEATSEFLGKESPIALGHALNLGLVYFKWARTLDEPERYLDAVRWLETSGARVRMFELRQRSFRDLYAVRYLGLSYAYSGQVDLGKQHLSYAIREMRKQVGDDHPEVIATQADLDSLASLQSSGVSVERE